MNDYESIFRHRGNSYHQAMLEYPRVRRLEFENLFARLPLQGGEYIVDCPALGGYLQQNYSVPMRVESLDFCPLGEDTQDYANIARFKGLADRAVCLAASHHINNLDRFLTDLSGVVKTGGYIHLADVTLDNPIRFFLDDFVGRWTSTGHSGIWRSFSDLFPAERVETRPTPWFFTSEKRLVDFCRLLFGLDLAPTDYQVLEAIDRYVGLSLEQGTYKVDWKLTYADLRVQ